MATVWAPVRMVVSRDVSTSAVSDGAFLRVRVACAVNPNSVIGRWGVPPGEEGSYVEIRLGGRVDGFDGCNSFGGDWIEPRVGSAQFDDVATTLVACVGSGEEDYGLATARTAEVKAGKLVLLDREGNELAALSRAQ